MEFCNDFVSSPVFEHSEAFAKVLKLFHEKKITALWKTTWSFFNMCTCKYAISFQEFNSSNVQLVLLLALAFLALQT